MTLGQQLGRHHSYTLLSTTISKHELPIPTRQTLRPDVHPFQNPYGTEGISLMRLSSLKGRLTPVVISCLLLPLLPHHALFHHHKLHPGCLDIAEGVGWGFDVHPNLITALLLKTPMLIR